MRNLFLYLNPIERLGIKKYSVVFPAISTILIFGIIEAYVHNVIKDPMAVGTLAIFIPIVLIIYFSFRDGVRGGFITVFLTLVYYFYIIFTRNYSGEELESGVQTTAALAVVYSCLGFIIGWLRQKIDNLILAEADERRRYHSILKQLPVGVIIANGKGKIDFVNKKAENILGVSIPIGFDAMEGFFVKVLESKRYSTNKSYIARSVGSGQKMIHDEVVVNNISGKKVFLDVNVSTIKNSSGQIIAVAEIINDVTLQKEIENRKDDFVNMASHELRTPITSMKLTLEALLSKRTKYSPAKTFELLRLVSKQTDRLEKLVSDMLDVSRLQTGKLNILLEKVDVTEVISDVLRELKDIAGDRKFVFNGKLGMYVNGDRVRLVQVVTNLITNSIKYSTNDTPIIIRVIRDKSDIIVSIKDYGIGISGDQQLKIFDRLYQAKDDLEKSFSGLGMGLYISKEIIKSHGGKIWVESEKGKGSTFYFKIPKF